MNDLSSDVIIRILEFLPLSSHRLQVLRRVSKTFNEAASSKYIKKAKSFDPFRNLFPEVPTLPLRDIGDLDPLEMMNTPLCQKVFKLYFPYITPEIKEKGYEVDDEPEVSLEKMKNRLSKECYDRLSKFIPAHKKYDNEGGILDFTIFLLHDYIPLLQKEIEKKEHGPAKLPLFLHKLAVVKFFERFPEITTTNKIEREKEIIKAMEEGRKLQTYRFIDAVILTEEEKRTDVETLSLDIIDTPIYTNDVKFPENEKDGDECTFWPKRHVNIGNGMRYLKPLHCADLIALCCDPPYSITENKEPLECENVIRETLWENFQNLEDYEIIVWANMTSRWASEFEGGCDYWGNYLVSYYVKSLNIIIIGYGNSTD